jgi:hypothetical protein
VNQAAFKPLAFQKVGHTDLRPPISDNDHTRDDYNRGELLALSHADKALLLVVRLAPGRDAKDWKVPHADIEFLLTERDGRYIGTINRQTPERFCYLAGVREPSAVLGNTKTRARAYGGRTHATYFCAHSYGGYPRIEFSVTVLIGRGFFGGWKELVVQVPKKDLYVARCDPRVTARRTIRRAGSACRCFIKP